MSQRWRFTVVRTEAGRDVAHRDVVAAWNEILAGLRAAASREPGGRPDADEAVPLVGERDAGRERVTFAAPAPIGMTSRGELVDVVLPVGRLDRERLMTVVASRLPAGHVAIDAHDVWVGEPSLPSLVEAADYVVDVRADDVHAVGPAVEAILARHHLPRPGRDAGSAASDLRRLIVRLHAEPVGTGFDGAPPPGRATPADQRRLPPSPSRQAGTVRLLMRLRVDQEIGSGRPEEVVEMLGDHGQTLSVLRVERLGFVLREPVRPVPAARPGSAPVRGSARPRPGAGRGGRRV